MYSGRGFVEDFVWNYLEGTPSIIHASNSYWGPLASILIVPFFWILGPSFPAAQLPMVLLSSFLPLVSYAVAKDLLANHRQAIIAAVLTAFSGVYMVYWTVPEGFVPFAVAGSLSLYAAAKGSGGNWRWWALSGACGGLAQLARPDGAILLPAAVGVYVLAARARRAQRALLIAPVISAIAGYLAVQSPWLIHNWLNTGSPIVNPGVKTLFLREYNDMFLTGTHVNLDYFLAWGWLPIMTSKVKAFAANINVAAEALSYILLPVVALGLWSIRRAPQALPCLVYGATLFVAMTAVFTFPGPLGSLLHSLAALLPFLMACAALGLDRSVDLLVRFRPHLNRQFSYQLFSRLLVGGQILLTCGLSIMAVNSWEFRYSYALYPLAGSLVSPRLSSDETIMVVDPPAFFYFNSIPSVVVPNNEPSKVLETARTYNARFLLLEPAHVRPLDALYLGEEAYPEFTLWKELHNDRGQELKIYEING